MILKRLIRYAVVVKLNDNKKSSLPINLILSWDDKYSLNIKLLISNNLSSNEISNNKDSIDWIWY